jgi:RNA polymerase sigma factor (sigma-70 family)
MTPPEPVSSEEHMLALQRGDDRALNRLMEHWQTPLRSFLYRHTQNETVATDLAQETFVRIYQHRARFRSGAKFSTWMFQIALNLARDHARYQRRHPIEALAAAPEPTTTDHPASQLRDAETAAAVRTAIAGLPEDLREAVLLSEYQGLSHAEIGVAVGATPKAVETRLYRARQQLRQALGRFLKGT